MSDDGLNISPAIPSDLANLLALLSVVGLPYKGVAEYISDFLIARDAGGRLVGCAGLERHGAIGLLRSVAVAPEWQRSGLGSRLTARLLQRAAADGLKEVVLLTTTARDFFARRFGFTEAARADYTETLTQSVEGHLSCCSAAVFMRLDLREDK